MPIPANSEAASQGVAARLDLSMFGVDFHIT
jgi:hypothetical protein